LARKNPASASALRTAIQLLAEDPFHPRLRTHKLKGRLASSWACSVAYDLRIVFEFLEHEGEQAILLESVGSHDEVY
jgi:addiction module RelE/StbE family toxin